MRPPHAETRRRDPTRKHLGGASVQLWWIRSDLFSFGGLSDGFSHPRRTVNAPPAPPPTRRGHENTFAADRKRSASATSSQGPRCPWEGSAGVTLVSLSWACISSCILSHTVNHRNVSGASNAAAGQTNHTWRRRMILMSLGPLNVASTTFSLTCQSDVLLSRDDSL